MRNKKKKNQLKDVTITSVDLCDVGANQYAHMRIAKSDSHDNTEDLEEQALIKRLGQFFYNLFKRAAADEEDDNSGADSGNEDPDNNSGDESGNDGLDVTKAIQEIDDVSEAMRKSFASILADQNISVDERKEMLAKNLSQITDELNAVVGTWSDDARHNHSTGDTGQSNGQNNGLNSNQDTGTADVNKSESAVNEQGDNGNDAGHNTRENDPTNDSADDTGSSGIEKNAADTGDSSKYNSTEDSVKKGLVKDMIFDTSKMTAEERTQYEDLAKRFGTEEPKQENGIAAEELKKRDEAIAALTEQNKQLAESIKKMNDAQEERELTEIAKKFEILGKKTEELVPVLKTMKAAGTDAFNAYIDALETSKSTLEKSGVFSEIGKSGHGNDATPEDRINAFAVEIAKSQKISLAAAKAQAWEEHPELVAEYENAL